MNKIRILFLVIIIGFCSDFALRMLLSKSAERPSVLHPLYQPNSFWQVRANLNTPYSFYEGKEPILLRTNSLGMRMHEIKKENPQKKIRVAILGDSITFGWGLKEEQNCASSLQQKLGDRYEVLNFSGPDYTAFHGLQQYEAIVKPLAPDILVLAYGLYDSYEAKLTEKDNFDLLTQNKILHTPGRLSRTLDRFSFVMHAFHQRQYRQGTEKYESILTQKANEAGWKRKVPAEEFESCLSSIIKDQQSRKGNVVLLNTNLQNFETINSLKNLAQNYLIPLVDLRTIFDNIGQFESRRKQEELGLDRARSEIADDSPSILFRVYVPPEITVAKTIYIVANHQKLGDNSPNIIPLFDNGANGDEKANDRIWSLLVNMELTKEFYYTFTNSGPMGKWAENEGMLLRDAKNRIHFMVFDPTEEPEMNQIILPVYTFGSVPYSHLVQQNQLIPNEVGEHTIANRLEKVIRDFGEKK